MWKCAPAVGKSSSRLGTRGRNRSAVVSNTGFCPQVARAQSDFFWFEAFFSSLLKDRLSRYREINITVTGRKSGRAISIPVWFVLEDDKLYLLPVQGSDTQWYKNALKNPMIGIDARAEAEFQAVPITDATRVSSVVEKFRDKYGANNVKKYYSKFDVAVLVQTR